MFTCVHHLGILFLRAWFVTFVAPFMALSRLLGLGFSVLPLWSQLLVFPLALMIWLSLSTCHLVVGLFSFTWRFLLLYVDDMIITGDDPEYIVFVKARLSDQFLMSDLGHLRYFLRIKIFTPEGFFLSQEKYIQDLLDRASLTDHRTAETPMELNIHLVATDGEPLEDHTRYRRIVGSLVYLGVTRPDILYSVHILSQLVSAPTQIHYSHLLCVLRYLRGTISRRLFFSRSSSLQLQAYCDATWASDPSNRRSLSAYCVFLGGSLIARKSKKQVAVSRLSAEAELHAMALVTVEVT
jgi:hypothetical protein